MQARAAVVNDDLFPLEMRMTKNRGHVNYCARKESRRKRFTGNYALQHRQAEREKSCIRWRDDQSIHTHANTTGHEAEHHQFLAFQPIECLLAHQAEIAPTTLLERLFISG